MTLEILVADDHAIIRDGLKKILADTPDLCVAGEASNGHMALEMVRSRDWDAVVLDLSMPGRHGLELLKLIKTDKPKLPVLIFSMHQEEQYAVRAIRAGASGYLSKELWRTRWPAVQRRGEQSGRVVGRGHFAAHQQPIAHLVDRPRV